LHLNDSNLMLARGRAKELSLAACLAPIGEESSYCPKLESGHFSLPHGRPIA
jgi:hypothetical protein